MNFVWADKFLLKENTVGTCWSVEVFAEEYPIKIAIYNLPVSDFSEITATAVLTGKAMTSFTLVSIKLPRNNYSRES